MRDSDPNDDLEDDEDFDCLSDIENTPIYRQLRTERWLMEVLLYPAKVPKRHRVDWLTWMAATPTDFAEVLTALERDGLVQRDGGRVSATKAAISLRRLELKRAGSR